MAKFGVGQSVQRPEDDALLSGAGRYVDDLNLDGQAQAVFLRSPHAHAEIKRIDTNSAARAPGVVGVFTAEDVTADGVGPVPCVADGWIQLQRPDGRPAYYPSCPVLAHDRVRHVGDAVAMVVAESRDAARDAAERIAVEYQPLPHVVETAKATDADAPQLWPEAPNNISFHWEQGDRAATDEAMSSAAHVTRLELVNNRIIVNPIEPRGALGSYDPEGDRYTVHTNSQFVHDTRRNLANILGVEEARVRVIAPVLGGGFGMKYYTYREHVLVAWAAKILGRPVKWYSDRTEGFVSDTQARDHVTKAELALDPAGHITGLRVRTKASLGAYVSNLGPISPSLLYTRLLTGAYRTPAVHAEVDGVLTNTIFTDAYRGAGRPETFALLEQIVDAAARELDLSPEDIRRRNFIPLDQMPYPSPLEVTYEACDFEAVTGACMKLADWDGFGERRAAAEARGRRRGVGMAVYLEATGADPGEAAEVKFNDDGVTLYAGTMSSGQSHLTVYAQILHELLGVPFERIRVEEGDTDDLPSGGGTGGSRSAYMAGTAIKASADLVIEKGRKVASHLLEAAEDDIRFEDGAFRIAGTDRAIAILELAAAARDPANLPDGMESGLDALAQIELTDSTFPNGCHICEVEVDPETGAVTIENYTAVNDYGQLINPLVVAGQVHGGVAQGLGQALFEHCVYDSGSGQLTSGSFMDYCLPRARDLPAFTLGTKNTPTKSNPLGIKGCGESGAVPSVPAAVNAVIDALKTDGVSHINMPLTPERVWRAIQAAQKAA